jgi:hypothetical protein
MSGFREYLDKYLEAMEPGTVYDVSDEKEVDENSHVFTVLNTRNSITVDITIKYTGDKYLVVHFIPEGFLDMEDDYTLENVFNLTTTFVEEYIASNDGIHYEVTINDYNYMSGDFHVEIFDSRLERCRFFTFKINYDSDNIPDSIDCICEEATGNTYIQ